ncbi:hypothetical protein [Streptomyces aureus]|uniref:hypothetical protein n=1 Tax=Streptomyces aureus TaxID=193461 RepID=UPI003631DC74
MPTARSTHGRDPAPSHGSVGVNTVPVTAMSAFWALREWYITVVAVAVTAVATTVAGWVRMIAPGSPAGSGDGAW